MSVYFYGCVTIDGYIADKNHNLDWLYQTGTTEETDYEEFYKSMDITIMGKKTFNEIEKLENRKIWLNCGGFITIDKTEVPEGEE